MLQLAQAGVLTNLSGRVKHALPYAGLRSATNSDCPNGGGTAASCASESRAKAASATASKTGIGRREFLKTAAAVGGTVDR